MRISLTILVFCLTFNSCSSWKKELKKERSLNAAIHNVVMDFYNTSLLFKNHSVFSIRISELNYNKLVIQVSPDQNKFLPEPLDTIGSFRGYLPTDYLIIEEKLFYWNDSTKILSKEIVNVLNKYNRIDSTNVNGFQYIPEGAFIIDERQKGVDYYICKNDFTNYKKVTTSRAYGYYEPPKLKCN